MKIVLDNENIESNYAQEILKLRGINNFKDFLDPSVDYVQDKFDLDNMKEGVDKFLEIISNNSNITLVVDSDCDGFTSAAIMYQYIKDINNNIKIDYILHENKQHGLSDTIEQVIALNNPLVILPDSSSNDKTYHDRLKSHNIFCLVLDHHLADGPFSDNVIIINNQLSDNYNNKQLTGAGVAYRFCEAVDSVLGTNYAINYMDLAALGIIGDMGGVNEYENRYIIKNGLENINNTFFKELIKKQAFSMQNKINPTTVSFYIVPLINAMIRVGTQEEKDRLFTSFINGNLEVISGKRGSKGEVVPVCIESIRECTNARSRQKRIQEQAVEELSSDIIMTGKDKDKIIVIELGEDHDYPAELNGLIAMQLVSRYQRPVLIGRVGDDGYLKGSGRGTNDGVITSFIDFLNQSQMFDMLAGHDNAFGYSLKEKDIYKFINYANETLKDVNVSDNVYYVNFLINRHSAHLKDIILDLGNYEDLWGSKNQEPLIGITNVTVRKDNVSIMGARKDTIKITINGIEYIKFFAKDLIQEIENITTDTFIFNIVGKAKINDWGGNLTPQINILDYEILPNVLDF